MIKSVVTGQAPLLGYRYAWMAGKWLGQREKKGMTVPLHAHDGRPCWPTHTPDDIGRPSCKFVRRIMLKSTQGGDATTLKFGSQELGHT